MATRNENVGPVSLAVLLHVIVFGAMLAAYDFRPPPPTPLIVTATLVQDVPEFTPPPVVEDEPEPQPEPVIEEETPPPVEDNSEELLRQANEEKRRQDALLEERRLEELRKKEQEDKARKEREEAERKKREEEEKERKRLEAEKKRQEDIERQRLENERERRELEAEQRQSEIDAEAARMAAENSPEMDAYQFAISQKIRRYWSVPASATPDTLCVVNVRQLRSGEIVGVSIVRCNGDDAVKRSVEAAVHRASPLPKPSNPNLFRAELELNLRPEQ